MRNDREILGAPAVYPGHQVTLAYLITCKYPSLQAAREVPEGGDFAAALGDPDIPGAGGNVSAAIYLLTRVIEKKEPFVEALVIADLAWERCDSQKKNNPERWREGQEQADQIKDLLREKLASWKAT